MNDLFIKTMKKLQENRKVENFKAIKENKHIDLEGEEKDIITVIDPDLSTKEFKEKQQEINDIIDKTPDGEDVVDTEYVGMKIYTCPLCLSNFYSEVEMNSEDQCPICYETPDKFVYIGTVEQAPSEDDEKAVKQAENELDKTDKTSKESNDKSDEGEFIEENPETEEEPIEDEDNEDKEPEESDEDEDEEQRLVSSKSINTKEKVMNEDLKPEDIEDIIDLTDINNKLNNAESIEDLKNIIIIIPNSALRELAQTALTNCTDHYNYDVPYVASKIQEALKSNIVNEDQYENERRKVTEGKEEIIQKYLNRIKDLNGYNDKTLKSELDKVLKELDTDKALDDTDRKFMYDKFINTMLDNYGYKKKTVDESKILTEGGIYPVSLDEGAEEAFENKVGEILGGSVKVSNLELIPAKGFGGSGVYWFRATINVSNSDVIDKFINENTPTAKLLNDNNELIINSYSDISIEDDKYDSGITFDCPADCKLEFDMDDLDADADRVGDAIIQKLKENQETLINLLKEYEVDDIEESKKLKESDESILRLAKNSIVNGKLPEEIKYKDKTYKQFYVIDPDNSGETSDIYYCNMENTPSGDPQESNDYFYLKVALNKTENGYKGIKEIRFAEDLTESKGLKESPQQVPGTKIKRKNNEEKLDEGTDLKRIARYNEFDNGYVLFDYKKMTDEEAEQKAKEASEKDPYDVYYVEYDDVMNPRSDLSWINGISYNIDEYNFTRSKEKDENDKYPMIAKKDIRFAEDLTESKGLKESPQQVPGTKIKRKNNEEKLDEAKLTDYLNQQELDRLIRQNPVLKNVMKSYKVLDNMILEVTTDMGISYYKAVLNDNGELELYWISKDGKKLGDPFLLSESRIEEANNDCDDCWIMIEDCKKLNEEVEGFKYNNKEYTGLDTYTYTFTLDQKDKFEKAKKELAKTGTVTEIFINNGYGLEYKKDKNI